MDESSKKSVQHDIAAVLPNYVDVRVTKTIRRCLGLKFYDILVGVTLSHSADM